MKWDVPQVCRRCFVRARAVNAPPLVPAIASLLNAEQPGCAHGACRDRPTRTHAPHTLRELKSARGSERASGRRVSPDHSNIAVHQQTSEIIWALRGRCHPLCGCSLAGCPRSGAAAEERNDVDAEKFRGRVRELARAPPRRLRLAVDARSQQMGQDIATNFRSGTVRRQWRLPCDGGTTAGRRGGQCSAVQCSAQGR